MTGGVWVLFATVLSLPRLARPGVWVYRIKERYENFSREFTDIIFLIEEDKQRILSAKAVLNRRIFTVIYIDKSVIDIHI